MLKYFRPYGSKVFYGLLVATVFLCGVFAHFTQSSYRSYRLEFVLETDRVVDFDVYYDIGRGFNEVDHQSTTVETVGEPVTVSYCIPVWRELERLRFDPAKEYVRMKLYSITLQYDDGTSFAVPLESLAPRQQVLRHEYDGRSYNIETDPDGEDPIVDLTVIGTGPVAPPWKNPLIYLIWIGCGVAALFLGLFSFRFFIQGR